MGRKTIAIEYIQKRAKRNTTLRKRVHGLIKKLKEVEVLCNSQVMVIVMNHNMDERKPKHANNHLIQTYCSENDMAAFWKAYVKTTRKRFKGHVVSFKEEETPVKEETK
jgi:hypothetical protein